MVNLLIQAHKRVMAKAYMTSPYYNYNNNSLCKWAYNIRSAIRSFPSPNMKPLKDVKLQALDLFTPMNCNSHRRKGGREWQSKKDSIMAKYIYDEGIELKYTWFHLIQRNLSWQKIYLSEEKKKKRFIRIFRLTYGVTFVVFRDLGGLAVGWHGEGSNAQRTVGTLGRGELSPPITITAWAQKGGGVGGERAKRKKKKKRKYWFLANRHLEPSPGLRTLSLQLPPGKHLHASPPHPQLAFGHNVCGGNGRSSCVLLGCVSRMYGFWVTKEQLCMFSYMLQREGIYWYAV